MLNTFFTMNFSKDFIKTWKRFNTENMTMDINEGLIKTAQKIISTLRSKDILINSSIFGRLRSKQIQFLPQFGQIIKILSNN